MSYAGNSAEFMFMCEVNKIDWGFHQTLGKLTSRNKPTPHNCHNCGAPVHNHKCEYCNTEY
jgi:hypothetical protein